LPEWYKDLDDAVWEAAKIFGIGLLIFLALLILFIVSINMGQPERTVVEIVVKRPRAVNLGPLFLFSFAGSCPVGAVGFEPTL